MFRAVLLCALLLLAINALTAPADKTPAEKKPAGRPPPAQPVDVNSALATELQQLPGVGPATAHAIIHHRSRNGRFRRVEELLIIRGISRAKLRRLRAHVRLN